MFFLTLILTVMLNVEISMSISFFYSTIECNCRKLRECLVCVFKQPFLIFKQYFTHFNTLFYPHVFSQIFSNNNFQFLNTCTKWTYSSLNEYFILSMLSLPLPSSSFMSSSIQQHAIYAYLYKSSNSF